MHQLRLGSEPWTALVERIVDGACRTAAGLPADACRELVELILVVRIRQTTACGAHRECRPDGAALEGQTCGWRDPDPAALPAMFGAAAADLAEVSAGERAAAEAALAAVFHAVLSTLVVENAHCGQAAVCAAAPIYPLPRRNR
jgi:hypothetical protein